MNASNLQNLRKLFLDYYKDFKRFSNSGRLYAKEEDNYKREASGRMHLLLDKWIEGEAADLTAAEIIGHLKTILSGKLEKTKIVPNLTNWRDNTYILDTLLTDQESVDQFVTKLYVLLRAAAGDDPIDRELEDLLGFLRSLGCRANITKLLPTILLFYWNPKRFIFIKPTVFDRFLGEIGEEPLGGGKPLTVGEYTRVLSIMISVSDQLKDLKPRDMIDLQSFYFMSIWLKDHERPNGTPSHLPLNLILYGPPGTGKTHHLIHRYMPRFGCEKDSEDSNDKRCEMITFHQSYGYEDFVEGIKPVMDPENKGEVTYAVKDGIFKNMVERAKKNPDKSYALFIDEINRANISKVFGELITLIEEGWRQEYDQQMKKWVGASVKLPYSQSDFGIPDNLWLIGTMNTADRSIALLDTALRRRFEFEELMPDTSVIEKSAYATVETEQGSIDLVKLLDALNARIEGLYNRDHQIGHSYLLEIKTWDDLKRRFLNKIIPLLQEYFFDDWEKIKMVLNDLDQVVSKDGTKVPPIIVSQSLTEREFGISDLSSSLRGIYKVTDPDDLLPAQIIKIYDMK